MNNDTSVLIRIKMEHALAKIPQYARLGDAGMDLFSIHEYEIPPGCRRKIRTGIAMEIPPGYVGLIWDRGGMATTRGLTVLAGVVDSNYRGEIFVTLFNTNISGCTEIAHIIPGDKIAQILIQPIVRAMIVLARELSPSERGDLALGSSGR